MLGRRGSLSTLVLALGSLCTGSLGVAAQVPISVSPGDPSALLRTGNACPTFSWGVEDGAGSYELAVYRVGDGIKEEPVLRRSFPRGVGSWTPSLDQCLEPGGRYAWAVRWLGDDGGGGEWSRWLLFEVAPQPQGQELGAVLERVLVRYLGGRGVALEDPEELAALLAEELAVRPLAPPPVSAPAAPAPQERAVYMGQEVLRDEIPRPRKAIGEVVVGSTFGSPLADEAELTLGESGLSAADRVILLMKAPASNSFDWAWAVNSDQGGFAGSPAAGALFLFGGDGTGDSIDFFKDGSTQITRLKIFDVFQLPADTSGTRPTCSAADHEGRIYYDTSLGLCYCDGSSWKKVDGGAAC